MMREVLEKVARREISIDEAEKLLRMFALEEISNIAKLDVGREVRKGIPEIILAEGKTLEELSELAAKMVSEAGRAIISRASENCMGNLPNLLQGDVDVQVHHKARMIVVKKRGFKVDETGGKIGILAAGTADIPVAEEARIVAEEMGCRVLTAYDVGVAGIHRLLKYLRNMINEDVDVVIVVAGREGALPSVVAGVADVPIIAVPTSSGYGFGGGGLSALMAMLQSCSLGMAVVNIDGGVPAGAIASVIANRVAKYREKLFKALKTHYHVNK
ncbi:MAG: nickel pincer cofactor biosynthesis protein LarB [Nitrososphaeria archaeon]|nr:nickel pincer cofactor biosynthesis protein LarB [Aigarchaeota archaeon]MCX8187747.1 nickel pincer cofactor biosynthesis protein LarB [Nitrososphaeria archaeon]MDW8021837.1 nickel pincer cofactor biosynthesis protein LarB [Nitrososphaerota archaeon]